MVDDKTGLADVVVSIKSGLAPKTYPVPAEPLVIDQKGCEFIPYISAVMARQKVLVKNSDPFMHNVNHAPTPDVRKRPQNVAQMPDSPVIERAFDKPADGLMVRIKCDVHEWMFAFIAVFDHPFFAVSGKDGSFRIANVPPGKYVIEAYHRKAGRVTKEIEIGDKDVAADFTLQAKTP